MTTREWAIHSFPRQQCNNGKTDLFVLNVGAILSMRAFQMLHYPRKPGYKGPHMIDHRRPLGS